MWAAENPDSRDRNLSANTEVSNEGFLVLSWDGSEDASALVLEQSSDPDFGAVLTRELGSSGATTVTGLANGEYYFRLSSNGDPVSTPVRVTVAHHSLARAGSFFLLGACLFGLLVTVILRGNREAGR